MPDYVRTEQITKRIRYELASPTNGTQLNKALAAACNSFLELRGRPVTFDDDLTVSVEDDLLVISFKDHR